MSQVEQDRQAILDAKQKGTLATLMTYAHLSGPGWLQGAITLGGGIALGHVQQVAGEDQAVAGF